MTSERSIPQIAGAGAGPLWRLALLGVALSLAVPGLAAQQGAVESDCAVCHQELEFLRQRTTSLDEARRLLVPLDGLHASAHQGVDCAECHTGFRTFPHAEAPYSSSRSCSSCHQEQRAEWGEGVHASPDRTGADCRSCHGTHDVRSAADLREDPVARTTMDQRCEGCHETSGLPAQDAHAGSAACSGCHGSHGISHVDEPHSRVGPERQSETCGACHEDVEDAWSQGAHGAAVQGGADGAHVTADANPITGSEQGHRDLPTCGACHLPHNTLSTDHPDYLVRASEQCKACHHEYADTYMDAYHGQATTLGSRASATCVSCHSAHSVFPATDSRSMVHESNLVETCATCHPAATASFVAFAPHADHNDRENYPLVYWSYRLMTALLIGVFTVFGLHTALWLLRLTVFAGGPQSDLPKEDR
jgi:hypothetical protein